MKTCRWST